MKTFRIFFSGILFGLFLGPSLVLAKPDVKPVTVRVFHSPTCKACLKVIHDIIPPLAAKYGDQVLWDYIDISDVANYVRFLSLEKPAGRKLGTPTLVIGPKVISGLTETADSLEPLIQEALASAAALASPEGGRVDLLERFRSFGPWAVIGAGLVDGVNPCAFTVIVFFISFLSVMGYKRREMAAVGLAYIFAIFVTYLALGFGCFKAICSLREFYLVSKAVYLVIGALSFFLGYLALRDYYFYKKTGQTDGLALQLPGPIKRKIHAIVGEYYRKDKSVQTRALGRLIVSALVVGFLVSLLEAVCTGQMYLPTIIFVLKEETLRVRAFFYLLVYNLMFVVPLFVILVFFLKGATSRHFEAIARRHLGAVKLAMAAVFLALAFALWIGM